MGVVKGQDVQDVERPKDPEAADAERALAIIDDMNRFEHFRFDHCHSNAFSATEQVPHSQHLGHRTLVEYTALILNTANGKHSFSRPHDDP